MDSTLYQIQIKSKIVWSEFDRKPELKYCYGKTPMQTSLDSLPLAKKKMLQYRKTTFQTKRKYDGSPEDVETSTLA